MRQRPVLVIASVLLVLLLACAGVLVADASTRNKIPDGVEIGGVPVGGLNAEAADNKVRTALLDKLRRPVRVVHSGRHWTLTPEQAKVDVNLDEAVAQAVALGKGGNAFSRVYREVSGGTVVHRIDPTSTYSKRSITRLLNRVEKDLNRKPKEAAVSLSGGKLSISKGVVGLELRRPMVISKVRKALLDPSAPHQISAATTKQQPKMTTADVKKKYHTVLVADRSSFRLTLYKNFKVAKSYGISVGKAGHDTPAGQYSIANKDANPAWHVPNSAWAGDLAGQVIPAGDPANPIKARWMGIYDGVGIHGTSDDASIGTNASHGCLRMHVPDVEDLFPRVPVGTPIWIL